MTLHRDRDETYRVTKRRIVRRFRPWRFDARDCPGPPKLYPARADDRTPPISPRHAIAYDVSHLFNAWRATYPGYAALRASALAPSPRTTCQIRAWQITAHRLTEHRRAWQGATRDLPQLATPGQYPPSDFTSPTQSRHRRTFDMAKHVAPRSALAFARLLQSAPASPVPGGARDFSRPPGPMRRARRHLRCAAQHSPLHCWRLASPPPPQRTAGHPDKPRPLRFVASPSTGHRNPWRGVANDATGPSRPDRFVACDEPIPSISGQRPAKGVLCNLTATSTMQTQRSHANLHLSDRAVHRSGPCNATLATMRIRARHCRALRATKLPPSDRAVSSDSPRQTTPRAGQSGAGHGP
jgi:hypothetical protein